MLKFALNIMNICQMLKTALCLVEFFFCSTFAPSQEHLPYRQHSAVELVGDSRCYIGGAATVHASPTERDVIVVRARRMAAKLALRNIDKVL